MKIDQIFLQQIINIHHSLYGQRMQLQFRNDFNLLWIIVIISLAFEVQIFSHIFRTNMFCQIHRWNMSVAWLLLWTKQDTLINKIATMLYCDTADIKCDVKYVVSFTLLYQHFQAHYVFFYDIHYLSKHSL